MKTTKNGYRLSKNGSPIKSFEVGAVLKFEFKGNAIKENGTYYFLNRKQSNTYVYLP